jgi:hypothetical protein
MRSAVDPIMKSGSLDIDINFIKIRREKAIYVEEV